MHVITRKRLLEFGRSHADAVTPLDVWYRLMKAGQFKSWAAIKETFGTADNLGKGLVAFNIGGNKYRLVASVQYTSELTRGTVWVRHVFTHADYDSWSKERRKR